MIWTELHGRLMAEAFERILGRPELGAMAFVRCLPPEVVEALASDCNGFAPKEWLARRVADVDDLDCRTITADRAVELREAPPQPVLLLVDPTRAGAGMDGIYSATREIHEATLFREASRLALGTITRRLSAEQRRYADRAVKKAQGHGQRHSISPWQKFDFFVRVAAESRHPGSQLHLLGLWPVQDGELEDGLDISRVFVDRLVGPAVAARTPAQRIVALKLAEPTDAQLADLERFVRIAATKPLLTAIAELADKPHLWVGNLRLETRDQQLRRIKLESWRNARSGKIAAWTGLKEPGRPEEPPRLVLDPKAAETGNYSKFEIRWKTEPAGLEKGAVEYRVAIVSDMDEELVSREFPHSGKAVEKCRFSDDDFSVLNEDSLVSAKAIVTVLGNEAIEPQDTEEFNILFGVVNKLESAGVGKKVRTASEGFMELDDRELVTASLPPAEPLKIDSRNYVLVRTTERTKTYRVYCPPLIQEATQDWAARTGAVGRWRVRVRAAGDRTGEPEFVPFDPPAEDPRRNVWDRVVTASRNISKRSLDFGSVGYVYDDKSPIYDMVKEYLLAWAALLEDGDPAWALANTVEVQSLSGRTIGLIVLPGHPLRIAWHVAYDNLVMHAKFVEGRAPKDIRKEFEVLDGAMFPAFLPGLQPGSAFVFADTLGFHAVGMIPDSDQEPKAAVAILARALGESESLDSVPTVGRQSAQVLGDEIRKYLECHDTSRFLRVHALRAGDGLTVARSLGRVQRQYERTVDDDQDDEQEVTTPAFVLELYPSPEQRGVAGRFIAETREKRRSGAGTVSEDDRWMLESLSLPGGMNVPRLRWARKETQPKTAAHLAVAFDTFESRVISDVQPDSRGSSPYVAFGAMSFFSRQYASLPSPVWQSFVPEPTTGEKHPSDRLHTERLIRMQQAIQRCVARHLGADGNRCVLKTEISPDKAHSLRELHRLCDWVITLDRNAGIEYFDSPRDNREIYDAYVIDCVPEREDLGCLQLITSTSNLDEVRKLLDGALDQMGLSHSRRNAEFLMEHLKALSGRLAIRLTGQRAHTSELIALAMSHANCGDLEDDTACWTPLSHGFLLPVDDVRDLLPPLTRDKLEDEAATRPDLIYVSVVPRRGLAFQFVEIKYRRHLRTARSPETLEIIRGQVESLRQRWDQWYSEEESATFRAIRRAKLARVLHFYADKARRHASHEQQKGLSADAYAMVTAEIDRMLEKGGDYSFAGIDRPDRGWVFCPEYLGARPLEISPGNWETRVFLFGSRLMPDTPFFRYPVSPVATDMASPNVSNPKPHADDTPGISPSQRVEDSAGTPCPQTAKPAAGGSHVDGTMPGQTIQDREPNVCLGTDLFAGKDVCWPLTLKGNPHLLIAGLPGMGKTTCLINLCKQMITFGIRPILFSYHEDIDQRLESLFESVRFLDFSGLGFNPLQVIDRQSRMSYLDVAAALRDIFVAIYPELGDIQGESIRTAIKQSFLEKGWDDPQASLQDLQEPSFGRFLEILRADPKPKRGLRSLLGRLEELADYGFFGLAESHDSLWDSEQPLVIRIHRTQNDNLQKAFASLVFYKLYKDMFRRGIQQQISHAVIFDEAHRAARLTLIPTMAKECRKYGISLVLASQEARDFHVSLFSAIANYLVLRVTEADAKALIRNVASSDQERALIDKIKQMERFKALYFSEQQKKPAIVALRP